MAENLTKQKQRLRNIFDETIDSDLKYDGSLEEIDYYGLMCKAASKDKLFKFSGSNLCMFNFDYENSDSVLMIFMVPINSNEDVSVKNIAERVMEIVTELEDCFITINFLRSEEVKEDKFIYVVAVKKLDNSV